MSTSKRQAKSSQNVQQPDSDDIEADYYRRARDDEYSEGKSADLSDDEEYEEEIDDEGNDVDEVVEEDIEDDDEEEEDESEEEDTLTSEVFKVQVLSDFNGEQANDLSIKTGDVLTIKEMRKDGWWLAEDASGNIGVVPKTLIERIPSSPTERPANEKKMSKETAETTANEPKIQKTRSGAELWGKVKEKKIDKKTSVTDVLKAMGAMPSGFRKPTLGKLLKEEEHRIAAWVYPKLTASNLAFRDLHLDPVEGKLRSFPVRITRHCSILSARMVPRVGTGVKVISRQINVALWDGKQILSNVHTIRTSLTERDPMLWNVVKNPQLSIFDGDFLARSHSQLSNVGILFELTVSFIREKTGEKSDVSCGWCVLKLFQETGAPTENKNWELPLNGGTPYDSNIELDPSANANVTGGLMQSLLSRNRQPRLVVKLAPVTKVAKDQLYDLLPETLVTAVQYVPFIALYREILADELVQNIDSIPQTNLIPDPLLSSFPRVLSYFDFMDALKVSWDERVKKSLRQSMRQRDRQERKRLFRSVYMNTVFPLLKLVSLPQLVAASPESEEQRSRMIQEFLARRNTVNQLLSDEFSYRPFNINRTCLDIISRHSIPR
ncbi:nephrocystin-1-like isoform X2 [Dendronephthya gigantea]|uniref:nephrocystin-1-like isoform X2 n=1 Tax=Dendronephthya gigantea TaxID=151771 RepID=UPI001068DEFC|nr:nephrocystin-1-like isoform X2 [Dendronephthya gigantea]XP_028407128.1 nephrocystin-1-like isoform X2 [Dendronephthya gigantea]